MPSLNNFPVLQKGCCCNDLAVATLGLGFLQIFFEFLDFFTSMWYMVHGWRFKEIGEAVLVILCVVFDFIELIVLGFLLIGILKKNLTFINLFVQGQPIIILTVFIGHVVMMVGHVAMMRDVGGRVASGEILIFSAFIISVTVLYSYIWWCAHSLYQKWIKTPTVRHADKINNGERRAGNNEDVTSFAIEAEDNGFENVLALQVP